MKNSGFDHHTQGFNYSINGDLAKMGDSANLSILKWWYHWDMIYTYIGLVGGLEHFFFFHILGIIIPTDQYFSEGLKPPTRAIF